MIPPGQPYSYISTSTVGSASDFRVSSNGVEIFPDITGKSGDWTINVAAIDVACKGPGQPGVIKIYVRSGSTWVLEHEEEVGPCN